MIAFRIRSSTARMHRGATRKPYKHIVDVMIQSASFYSAGILAQAVCQLLDTSSKQPSSTTFFVLNYVNALTITFTGIAPMVMVARLAILRVNNEDRETNDYQSITTDYDKRTSYCLHATQLEATTDSEAQAPISSQTNDDENHDSQDSSVQIIEAFR
ncbi:hypothetical protein CPC08DRAFT_796311 [Agrocybe pediades]|nr:hypothetical protein CPC08DRAFT_796311 [Agrocybe pediades]